MESTMKFIPSRTDYGSTTTTPAQFVSESLTSLNSYTSINASIKSDRSNIKNINVNRYQNLRNLYPTATPNPRFRPVRAMTVDRMPNSVTHQVIERVEFFLNIVNQICIGFVTIYMSWLCLRTGLAGTALHAWLVTIGFSFLMAEAIMCHYSGNVLTHHYHRSTKTTIHWLLQVLGGGCGIAGSLIKLIQKGFLLKSTHGKLGFCALILCTVSMLSGLFALYATRLKPRLSPLLNKTFHNFLGIGTFIVALLAQYYGYQTNFFKRKTEEDFRTLIMWITLVSLVLTNIGPLKALYHKFCNVIRHFH